MLSLQSCGCCRVSTARAFQFQTSPSFFFSATNYKSRLGIARTITAVSGFAGDSGSDLEQEPVADSRTNYAGVRLEETVDSGIRSEKLRLDSWISSRISGISRGRVQSSIRAGLVHVNGRVVDKVISICFCFRFGYYSKLQLDISD